MISIETRLRSPGQVIIAGIIACLIVLQGLVFAASPALAGRASHSVAASTIEGDCHAFGGDKGPAQGHLDHSQCCVLCRAGVRDLAPLIVSALPVVVTRSTPEPALFFVRFVKDDFEKHPIGWTTSWSSRSSPRSS